MTRLFYWLGMSWWALFIAGVQAAQAHASDLASLPQAQRHTGALRDFQLERMPLTQALAAFSALTGYSILYESAVVKNLYSQPVSGRIPPALALERLLTGTPLSLFSIDKRSFIVRSQAQNAHPRSRSSSASSPSHNALVQRALISRLCQKHAQVLRQHRIALRILINPRGQVEQARVRIATQPAAEPALQHALYGLTVGPVPYGVEPTGVWLIDQAQAPQVELCP